MPWQNGDGKSWGKTGKYHKVQDLALAITEPKANVWLYLSGAENGTILQSLVYLL